jgi:plastocyanin
MLSPGHCKRIGHTKVCARAAKTKTVTTTVAVSGIGKTFTGNGDSTLAPLTLTAGDEVHWTAQPDSDGNNFFVVTSSSDDANFVEFDNGDGATSGSTFIPAGTYTFEVDANATWTLSF